MIERTQAFKASDGNTFSSLDLAQAHELKLLFEKKETTDADRITAITAAHAVVQNADFVIDILTTTATSKPRARKINGGKKQRKPAAILVSRGVEVQTP